MSFQTAKATLGVLFAAEAFAARVRAGERHTADHLLETCTTGARLFILFPGYKAKLEGDKPTYDYRIDIERGGNRTALSHANIIADIYHKVASGAIEGPWLRDLLKAFAVDGVFGPALHSDVAVGTATPPSPQILQRIDAEHGRLGKIFNRCGNERGLTLEELFTALKWIVLQEDFNYPIGRFEGRRMCFARYVEAVHVAESADARLEELIARTLSHGRPQKWPEVDYTFLAQVV